MCNSPASLEVARHCLLMRSREKKNLFFSSLLVYAKTFIFVLVNCLISTNALLSILFSLLCPDEEVSESSLVGTWCPIKVSQTEVAFVRRGWLQHTH